MEVEEGGYICIANGSVALSVGGKYLRREDFIKGTMSKLAGNSE